MFSLTSYFTRVPGLSAILEALVYREEKRIISAVASKPGGRGGSGPPLFCHAVSNENNMKNSKITNGLIFENMLHSLLPGCQ